jgi:hypothetical protein
MFVAKALEMSIRAEVISVAANCIMIFAAYIPVSCYQGSQIKNKAMDSACSMHIELRNEYQIFGKPKDRDHYEDLCVGRSIILK